jgi:hypothetical protein
MYVSVRGIARRAASFSWAGDERRERNASRGRAACENDSVTFWKTFF